MIQQGIPGAEARMWNMWMVGSFRKTVIGGRFFGGTIDQVGCVKTYIYDVLWFINDYVCLCALLRVGRVCGCGFKYVKILDDFEGLCVSCTVPTNMTSGEFPGPRMVSWEQRTKMQLPKMQQKQPKMNPSQRMGMPKWHETSSKLQRTNQTQTNRSSFTSLCDLKPSQVVTPPES